MMLGRIKQIMAQDRPPLENLSELFDMWKQMSETKEGCGCLMGNTIAEFGLSRETVANLLKEQMDGLYTIFLHSFTDAREKGYLPKEKEPQVLAASMVAISQGLALLSKMGYEDKLLEDVIHATETLFTC